MEINGQMTIFDFLDENPELDVLPELQEIIKRVKSKFGLNMTAVYDGALRRICYRCTVNTQNGKTDIDIHDSEYTSIDRKGQRFVSVGISYKTSGMGAPCDSLKEIFGILERRLL